MIVRYPHTVDLIVSTEVKKYSGISGNESQTFKVEGRFEPAANRTGSIDYKAKFYCQNLDYLLKLFLEAGFFPEEFVSLNDNKELKPFSVDGQTIVYDGKKFEIVLLQNYQTHCEIWLE